MPGPVPKRADQRRRRNKTDTPIVTAAGATNVRPPAEDRRWHLSARRWYRALKKSGQSQFFEPSDWALAQWVCDLLTLEMESGRLPRANMIAELNSMMDALLTSEGARRRLRVELVREADSQAAESAATVIPLPSQLYG